MQLYVPYGAGLLGNGRSLLRVLAARLLPGARAAAALRAQEPRARASAGSRRRAVDHEPHAPQAATAGIQAATACVYTVHPQTGAEPSAELISHYLEQLRAGSKLSDRDMLAIFGYLLGFVSLGEAKLVELLSMVPGSSPLGCLAPTACGRQPP